MRGRREGGEGEGEKKPPAHAVIHLCEKESSGRVSVSEVSGLWRLIWLLRLLGEQQPACCGEEPRAKAGKPEGEEQESHPAPLYQACHPQVQEEQLWELIKPATVKDFYSLV